MEIRWRSSGDSERGTRLPVALTITSSVPSRTDITLLRRSTVRIHPGQQFRRVTRLDQIVVFMAYLTTICVSSRT
jgi:hypothetical protein